MDKKAKTRGEIRPPGVLSLYQGKVRRGWQLAILQNPILARSIVNARIREKSLGDLKLLELETLFVSIVCDSVLRHLQSGRLRG